MADCGEQVQPVDDVEEEATPGVEYKPPAEKTIEEILNQDTEDESLRKYKQTLLGTTSTENVFFPEVDKDVILRKMSIIVEDRPDEVITLDDPNQLKNMNFIVKEGVKYRLRIAFNVQRQIVSGLKLVNKVSRGPVNTKETYMVGSYGPRMDVYEFTSGEEEFPKGLLGRGEYKVKSLFTDDDKKSILEWEWTFNIKKDWKS